MFIFWGSDCFQRGNAKLLLWSMTDDIFLKELVCKQMSFISCHIAMFTGFLFACRLP